MLRLVDTLGRLFSTTALLAQLNFLVAPLVLCKLAFAATVWKPMGSETFAKLFFCFLASLQHASRGSRIIQHCKRVCVRDICAAALEVDCGSVANSVGVSEPCVGTQWLGSVCSTRSRQKAVADTEN